MRSNSPQRAINKSCREAQARGGRNFSAEKYSVYFDEKVKKKITKSDVVFQNSEQGREERKIRLPFIQKYCSITPSN